MCWWRYLGSCFDLVLLHEFFLTNTTINNFLVSLWSRNFFDSGSKLAVVVVVFPQAPFRVTNVPGHASAGIIQLRNCTMASWGAVGDFVTPFVLESCLIIHVSVELAGSYLGHVPCKFWKVCLGLEYLPQISYGGKLTCFGCSPRIGYHWYGLLVKWACSFCMT